MPYTRGGGGGSTHVAAYAGAWCVARGTAVQWIETERESEWCVTRPPAGSDYAFSGDVSDQNQNEAERDQDARCMAIHARRAAEQRAARARSSLLGFSNC